MQRAVTDEDVELEQLLMRQREALARLGNGMRLMGAVTWLFVATVAYDALGLTMWLGSVTMMVGAVVAHRVRWVRLWGTALIDVPVLFAGMYPIVGTVDVDLGLLATTIVVPIVLMAAVILGIRGAVIVGLEAIVLTGVLHVSNGASLEVVLTSVVMLSMVIVAGSTIERRVVALGRAYASAQRRQERLSRYFSPAVAQQIGDALDDSATRREVTVLFSDIRGFTSRAEDMSPEEALGLLNEVHGAMVAEVFAESGTLDKFLGDGMLAYFGAPLARPDHRERAMACAQRMMRALDTVNAERGLDLRMGIGLHTGEVVLGPVGSPSCREYTVIGDAVNVAARLEALTKDLGVPVLASESVVGHTEGWLPHGTHELRGRKEPVLLYVPASPSSAEDGVDAA